MKSHRSASTAVRTLGFEAMNLDKLIGQAMSIELAQRTPTQKSKKSNLTGGTKQRVEIDGRT
jgi:hypothetical protein